MVALATVTGAAHALLLLAALLPSARADDVTWSRCKENRFWHDHDRDLTAGRDDNATKLDLCQCLIRELHMDDFKTTALPNLIDIALDGNMFEHIDPAVFIPVSHLNGMLVLGNNILREVPIFGAHALFPRLRVLILSSNHITSITHSNTFSSCVQLEALDLNYNIIEYIDQDVFKQLHNLKRLYLVSNKIVSISETIFRIKSLKELYLYNNLIEYVAPHAFRGTNLSSLAIYNNRLAYLPEHFAADLTALTGHTVTHYGGIISDSFSFFYNPWHCACLLELLADVKRLGVRYYSSKYNPGTEPACVFVGRRPCGRPAPSALLPPPRGAPN